VPSSNPRAGRSAELTKTLTEDVIQNLKVSFNAAARRKCRLAEIDYLQSLLWTLTLQLIEEQNRLRREISIRPQPPKLG